jgi:hypothetical protein
LKRTVSLNRDAYPATIKSNKVSVELTISWSFALTQGEAQAHKCIYRTLEEGR